MLICIIPLCYVIFLSSISITQTTFLYAQIGILESCTLVGSWLFLDAICCHFSIYSPLANCGAKHFLRETRKFPPQSWHIHFFNSLKTKNISLSTPPHPHTHCGLKWGITWIFLGNQDPTLKQMSELIDGIVCVKQIGFGSAWALKKY